MKTLLNEMNFNFQTTENSIKTIGTIILICTLTLLVINSFINPVDFTF